MIADFSFHEIWIKKLFFMIFDQKFCMIGEELELRTNIHDFATLFFVILRRDSSEWSESSIESTQK